MLHGADARPIYSPFVAVQYRGCILYWTICSTHVVQCTPVASRARAASPYGRDAVVPSAPSGAARNQGSIRARRCALGHRP